MHRWLHRLTSPWEAILREGENEGGSASGSAADSGGGATPAASPSGDAPAAPSSSPAAPTPAAPDGGAAPTPQATPASEPASQRAEFDFMDFEEGDPEPGVAVVEPPAAPAQAQPTPQAAPQPSAPPAQPQQVPGGQAPQGAGAQAPEASPIPSDPGELVDSIRQNAPALIEQMAQSYVLSKEEAEALENDVVGTLPKILARVHLNASVGALHNMKELIPGMIKQAIQADRTKRDNLESFYKAWPQLDRGNKDHQDAISQLGSAYRRANPTASREQAIKAIGTLALHHLGLPLGAPAGPNGRTISQRPFVPAQGGGATAPAPSPEYDQFAGMGLDFDE